MCCKCILQKLGLLCLSTLGFVVVVLNTASAAPVTLTGFESGTVTDDAVSTSGTFSYITSSTITGGYSLRSNPTGAADGFIRTGVVQTNGIINVTNFATAYIRFNFRVDQLPASNATGIFQCVQAASGARKLEIRITSAGLLQVINAAGTLVATGTTGISTGVVYEIKLICSTGAGAQPYSLFINNVTELSGTADQGSTNFIRADVGKLPGSADTVNFVYDDLWIDNASLPPSGVIKGMAPTINGSTIEYTGGDATCNATTATCFSRVSEIPTDDDVTYIEKSAASSQSALVRLAAASVSGISGTINAVKSYQNCKESVTAASATAVRIRSNGVNSDSGTVNLTTAYTAQQKIITTDPGTTAAFTIADLNQIEVGTVDGSAALMRCSTFRLFVDYTPGASGGAGSMLLTGVGG